MTECDDDSLDDTSSPDDIRERITEDEAEFSVFVSYRINPDQPLAIALRELIEGTIVPTPKVFVSGAGGLRPSNIGFKPQIQSAVQTARAFVAIITQQSKNREWIFFEAGAAFGRQQLYAPLLIDTSATDLASSIADYQAARATNRDECERLVNSIAEAVGGTVKPRFGTRYGAFCRRIQNYRTASDVGVSDEGESSLGKAVAMLMHGEVDEANLKFDELEASAESPQKKALVRVARVVNSNLPHVDLVHALEEIENEFGPIAESQYFLGLNENRPSASIQYYRNCLELVAKRPEDDEQAAEVEEAFE